MKATITTTACPPRTEFLTLLILTFLSKSVPELSFTEEKNVSRKTKLYNFSIGYAQQRQFRAIPAPQQAFAIKLRKWSISAPVLWKHS